MTIIEDFISTGERQELLDWVRANEIPVLQSPVLETTHTIPRRKKIHDNDGPKIYYEIQARIAERFDLSDRNPTGWNGQVFVHEPEMGTREHVDGGRNGAHRMTLMVQKAEEGGDLIHDNKIIDVPECGLAMYDASIPHAVSQVVKGERIVFIFFWLDS